MSLPIVDSSPLMAAAEVEKPQPRILYPFDSLELSQSFTVKIVGNNAKSLRACVRQRNKKDVKKFALVAHIDLGILEVGRVL